MLSRTSLIRRYFTSRVMAKRSTGTGIPDHDISLDQPKRPKVEATIQLSSEENLFCTLLDQCAIALRNKHPDQSTLELRIAGGWVRDKLLGRPSNDLDVAISSMTGQQFAVKFLQHVQTNSSEEVGKVATIMARPDQSKHLETATTRFLGLDLDFVQLRSEEYSETSRIPDKIEFGTPLQDAMRRDITINALFYNVHTKEVEDHTGKGLSDLHAGNIRTPLPARQTLHDDPLRLLRCIRFASRFRFRIDSGITVAAEEKVIRDALMEKVSRERIGIELEKMLKDANPLLSVSMMNESKLYDLIFTTPPLVGDNTQLQSIDQALGALTFMQHFISNPVPHAFQGLVPLHHKLSAYLKGCEGSVRKRLYLACCLLPFQHLETRVGKRTVWAGERVISESIKFGNHDRDYVSHLFSATSLMQDVSLTSFQQPSERIALGRLLRSPHVHDIKATHTDGPLCWQAAIAFSLISELRVSTGENDYNNSRIEKYNQFVDRLLELNLEECLTPQFEKNRLDGKEVCLALNIKPGKALAGIINQVIDRQIDCPLESKDQATSWLKQQVEAGHIITA